MTTTELDDLRVFLESPEGALARRFVARLIEDPAPADPTRSTYNADVVTLVEWLVYAVRADERAVCGLKADPKVGTLPDPQFTAKFVANAKGRLLDVVLDRSESVASAA